MRERRRARRRSRRARCGTPIARRPTSTSTVRSTSAMTMSSETSSSSCVGREAVRASSSRSTSDGRPRSSRSAGPRLTATPRSRPRARSAPISVERPVEHERGQRAGQPALLDEREEVAGAEQAALRVLPAHERLDAAHGAGPQLGLRLVVQDELAGLERGAELADQREPLAAVAVAARRGRPRGRCACASPRTSRRRRAAAGRCASREWSGKSAMPTLASMWTRMPPTSNDCSSAARSRRPAVLAVASSPGWRTTANSSPPRRASVSSSRSSVLEARADLAQHLVAGVVAERVVELLEAVEVDQQQRQLVAASSAPTRSRRASGSTRWRRLPSPVRSSVMRLRAASRAGARRRSARRGPCRSAR